MGDDKHTRDTRHFTPDAIVGWQFAIATLERLNKWSVYALRLGTLALLQECVRHLTPRKAKREILERAKEIIAALENMPWDG